METEKLKVIQFAHAYGTTLELARHLDDEEKKKYTEAAGEYVVVSCGESIELPFIKFTDAPDRYDETGAVCHEWVSFPGCGNDSYVISDKEWDAYIALNAQRAFLDEEKKRIEHIEQLLTSIAACRSQKELPTRAAANEMMDHYNNLHNEGGDGYVPYIYSYDEYDRFRCELQAELSSPVTPEKFPALLKAARAATGLTQAKAAAQLLIPVRTWEDWERGASKPAYYDVRMICLLLQPEGGLI